MFEVLNYADLNCMHENTLFVREIFISYNTRFRRVRNPNFHYYDSERLVL